MVRHPMLALTLSLVLTAAPASDGSGEHWSPNVARRHAGALIGAVVGAALPLAVLRVINPPCLVGLVCAPDASAFTLIASTMLGSVGLTLGHALGDGGEPSFGAAALGLMLSAVVNLGWLGVLGRTVPVDSPESAALLMASTVPITIAIQLLVLELRHDALERRPVHSVPWKRFGAAVGAGALTFAAGALSGVLLGMLFLPSSPISFLPVGLGLAAPLAPIAVTAAHRALGGRGGFGAAYLGILAALAASGVVILAGNFSAGGVPLTNINLNAALQATTAGFGVAALAAAALAGSAIAVELSHAKQEEEEPSAPEKLSVELTFAPIPNGGAAVLAGHW